MAHSYIRRVSRATSEQTATSDTFRAERKQHRDRCADLKNSLARFRDRIVPGAFGKLYQRVESYSMMSYARLKGIYTGACDVLDRGIAGDFVECGTARGGCAGLMALTRKQRKASNQIWIFDTFEGLPPPSEGDPDYDLAKTREGTCRGEFDEVKGLLEKLDVFTDIKMVKGLFQDTVAVSDVDAISLLHLDGDWYDSTKVCLDHLYDKVTPGGVIQIDDYGHWAGARKALHEFFDTRGIRVKLKYLDYTGRQFVKP